MFPGIDNIIHKSFALNLRQDGPLGIRPTDGNSVFPAGITVAATFDSDLMYQRGLALGQEFRGKGINVWLAPVTGT